MSTNRQAGLTSLLALIPLAVMLLLPVSADAAANLRFFTRDFGNPADSSDDSLHSVQLHWEDEDQPVRTVIYRDLTRNVLPFGISLNGVTNEDIYLGLQRSLARWSDVSFSEFEFNENFTFSDFWAGFLPFQPLGPTRASLDGFNMITFQDPNIILGDGVLGLTSIFYVEQDTDLTNPALIDPNDFVSYVDVNEEIVVLDINGDGIIDILLPYRKIGAGTIVDADVLMNQTILDWYQYDEDPPDDDNDRLLALGTFDIETIITHELGHAIGMAHSELFDATMTGQGYRNIGDFLTDPWEARDLDLDDEIAMGLNYPSGAFKGSAGISGKVIDGLSLTDFDSPRDIAVTQVPVFVGRRRIDMGLDPETFNLDTLTFTREGPVQLLAHVISGFEISLADGPNSPLVNQELPSDYLIRGLDSHPDWVVYIQPLTVALDVITAQFAGSEEVPPEFFGGATPPVPGDGTGIDPSNPDDLIFGNTYLQVAVNELLQFFAKITNGPNLMFGIFDPVATRNYSTIRVVKDGVTTDYFNYEDIAQDVPPGSQLMPLPAPPGLAIDDASDFATATYFLDTNVRVDVRLDVEDVPETGPFPEDVIINYTFTNLDATPVSVGLRHLYDYNIPGFNLNTIVNGQEQHFEREWVGAAVPSRFTVRDNDTLAQVEIVGQMRGADLTTPDRFVTALGLEIVPSPWDFDANGSPIDAPSGAVVTDPCAALYWNPVELGPGESITISTSYGYFARTDLTCPDIQDGICLPESAVPPQTPPTIFDDDPFAFNYVAVGGGITPNINIITNTGGPDPRLDNFVDTDGDGIPDDLDNCPFTPNPDQADEDGDGVGDVCEGDRDGDGIPDDIDNCPDVPNFDQSDVDGDGLGDACDPDIDGDGIPNSDDNCAYTPNPDQADTDGDGIGDACEGDRDGDGIPDEIDNCPFTPNPDQNDIDGDGIGDVCDPDIDGDGIPNTVDNCPLVPNPDQTDTDEDGLGDVCDPDSDGDGIPDPIDPSPILREETTQRLPVDNDFTYGAVFGDVDNDGDLDLVLANGLLSPNNPLSLLNRLYLNDGRGFFTDATFGVDGRPGNIDDRMPFVLDGTFSVRLADLDNDGDLDIFVSNFASLSSASGAQNRVYINVDIDDPMINPLFDSDNVGDGFFVDRTQEILPGVLNVGPGIRYLGRFDNSTKSDVGDIDGDGDIDIIVANQDTFRDPVATTVEYFVQQTSVIGKRFTSGPGIADPMEFNNRVLINNRAQSATPFGTPDPAFSFRDDTLGADNRFGGDVLDPTFLDRLPFVQPDIHQRGTSGPSQPFETMFGDCFEVILSPLMSDYALDLVAINFRNFGVGAGFVLDGQETFYENIDVTGDGIADGYYACVNFGTDYRWNVEISNFPDYDGSLFMVGIPDGVIGDAPGPEANLVQISASQSTAGAIFDSNNDGFNEVVAVFTANDIYNQIQDGTGTVSAAFRSLPETGGLIGGFGSLDLIWNFSLDTSIESPFPRAGNPGDFNLNPDRLPATNGGARSVVAADFDRDGSIDLFIANQPLTSAVTLPIANNFLINDTFGTFTDITDSDLFPSQEFETYAAAAGDVDNDGDIDLFVGNFGDNNQIFINNVYSPNVPPVLENPIDQPMFYDVTAHEKGLLAFFGWSLGAAFGDIDGDGDLDMAFTNGGALTVSGSYTFVLKNTGQPLNQGVYSLVASGSSFPTPRINQTELFGSVTADVNNAVTLPGYAVKFADFDNDGDNDLFATYYSTLNRIYMNHDSNDPFIVSIPDDDSIGDGHFVNETISRLPAITSQPFNMSRKFAIGDVNNDGLLDIVIANGIVNVGAPNQLLLNSRGGSFNLPGFFLDATSDFMPIVTYHDNQTGPVFDDSIEPALADFNGDGWLDMVILNRIAPDGGASNPDIHQNSRFLLNRGEDGGGNWLGFEEMPSFAQPLVDIISNWEAIVVGDFDGLGEVTEDINGNGRLDTNEMETINANGVVDYIDANSNGVFDSSWDIMCVRSDGTGLLLLNSGNLALIDDNSFERIPQTDNRSFGVTAGDLDLDGDLEIVIANGTTADVPSIQVWENLGVNSGFFADRPNEVPNPTSIKFFGEGVLDYNNNSRHVTLADVDGDGDLDLYVCNLGDEFFADDDPNGSVNYLFFNRVIGASWNSRDKFPYRTPGGGGPLVLHAQPAAAKVGTSFLKVRILGRNFKGGAKVNFGPGIQLSHAPIVINDNTMEAVIHISPDTNPGPRNITVTNPDGQIAIGRSGIFYVLSANAPSAEITLGAELEWDLYE